MDPKVAIFYLAFLPQFIGPTDPVVPKSLLLAGIHYIEGILWLVVVSIVVDQTRRFSCTPPSVAGSDGVCGMLLAGLGVRLALERQ